MKFAVFAAIFCIGLNAINAQMSELYSWEQLAFDWPSKEAEAAAIENGQYIPANNMPLGLERWNDKLFITVPRFKSGVASALNYIDLHSYKKSPKLRPYPSWDTNTLPIDNDVDTQLSDNATIISPFHIQVDSCDRLWVLDTGLTDILGNPKQITPNAIVIFDLKTDKLVRRFQIPKNQTKEDTLFVNIIVDSERSNCNDAFAYVPDLGGYGLVVYSFRDNYSYRVNHNFFHFDPLSGDFNVGGNNFQWNGGVIDMAIGPTNPDNSKDIFFHSLASTKQFKVSNRVLQNESYVTSPAAYYDFKLVGDRGINGQSTAEDYDKETGVLFYTQVNKDAIACWNVKRPYNTDTQGVIDSNSHTLEFTNDLKVDALGIVWALSNKMPTYLYKELDPKLTNYRILVGKKSDLIKGTPCET